MKILLISDIHLGALANTEQLGRNPEGKVDLDYVFKPIDDARTQFSLNPELIIIPGDLTSIGSPREFEQSRLFIARLAKTFDLSIKKIITTFGNHDIDWRVCEMQHFGALASETERTPRETQKTPDTGYKDLAGHLGPLIVNHTDYDTQGPVPGAGIISNRKADIIVLNSGMYCVQDQPYKHGKIGEKQFEWLTRTVTQKLKPSKINILAIHHHLVNLPYGSDCIVPDISTLEEGSELRKWAGESGIDLVLHGHRHHPIIHTETITGWKHPLTYLCAGSFGVMAKERADGNIPNTIHYIKLLDRMEDGALPGECTTLRYKSIQNKWATLHDDDNVAVDPIQNFGSPTTETDLQKIAEDIITLATNESEEPIEQYIELPEFNELPFTARCARKRKLNLAFSKAALKLDYQITGSYPEGCIAKKL